MRRRRLLATTAGLTAAGALGGCLGLLGNGGGGVRDEPSFRRYVTEALLQDGSLHAASLDPGFYDELPVIEMTPGDDDEAERSDPLLAMTEWGLLGAVLGLTVANRLGVREHVRDADRVHAVGEVVFEGSFDVAGVGSDLEAAGLSPAGEYEGFRRWSGTTNEQPAVVAATGDTLVVGLGSGLGEQPDAELRSNVEAIVDGALGERPRVVEEYDAFDELTTALSVRTFVGARFAPDGSLFQQDGSAASSSRLPEIVDLEGDALGYAIALDVDPGADVTRIHLAIRYAEPGAVDDQSRIQDAIAPTGTDREIETDGAMVTLRATYPSEAI